MTSYKDRHVKNMNRRDSFSFLIILFLKRNPLAVIGIAIVFVTVFISFTSQWLIPYNPILPELNVKLNPPTSQHWLGTDDMGRDIYSRILAGTRVSLLSAVIIISISMIFGLLVGLIAGYVGGWVDDLLMRITDIFLAFPALILAMAISATLGPSLQNALIAVSSVWWPWYARLIRGQVISIKKMEYIEAARCVGNSPVRIIFHHILPNAMGPIFVQGTLDIGNTILLTSSLSFIGLGAQPPSPEWGSMVSIGRLYLLSYWWVPTMPGFAILITALGFNLVGDALRDFADVRERSL